MPVEGISVVDGAALDQQINKAIAIQDAAAAFLSKKAALENAKQVRAPVIFNTSVMPEDPLRGQIVDTLA